MALRVLLVLVGLAGAGWAVHRDGEVRACDRAGRDTFRVDTDAGAEHVAARIEAACRGSAVAASASEVLAGAGREGTARRLARLAVAREPENAAAWVAAGTVARRTGDARGLAEARARLARLDPTSRLLG